ncbi:hypothetical protein KY290_020963 [Solanum tuberosum]|uniref:dihydroneopterin aldolase n=1 Tax=Solanum tuberosum TaxID=4113 RepID=A0ABQ7V056_SOLTU|nr:hypothetical protein KY289_020126 [Solanum tuberosum]KAH0692809.1 hypothetical protein KY285_019906 [Solanum tuberosum]KAH0757470.1 hypothetical protein KY290_020963 [Solanum tuberosum]
MGCSLRGSMTSPMDIPKGDKLVLRGLKFHGYHGVNPEETKLGQKFLVDVVAWIDLRPAGKSDCLSDTPSYTDIYNERDFRTLNMYPQVFAVRVQVGKPHVAVQGPVDYLGVEIIRHCRDLDV